MIEPQGGGEESWAIEKPAEFFPFEDQICEPVSANESEVEEQAVIRKQSMLSRNTESLFSEEQSIIQKARLQCDQFLTEWEIVVEEIVMRSAKQSPNKTVQILP